MHRLSVVLLTLTLAVALLPAGRLGSTASSAVAQDATPAAGAATGGWTNFKGDAGRTGVADAGPTGQPVQLWRVQAGGPCNQPPDAVAGLVYAPCGDGVLYALDAATGTERWRFTGAGPLGSATVGGGLVYQVDGDVLHALDAATGAERWQTSAPGGSPVVENGLLVTGTGDGYLLGLDAATGTERWRYRVSTTGAAHSPALAGGVAYVGGDDPGFFAVDGTTGTLLWKGDTGNDQTRTAVVAEGIAYIGGSPDVGTGHLYAFDATTGALRWTRDQPLFTPTVLDGVGYSGGSTGTVDAFDTATGTERWQAQIGGVVRNVAIADGVIYALSDGNNAVYALDAATGAQLWSFPVDGGIDGGIAVAGGVVYETTVFGGIYAIGGTDQGAVPAASPEATSASVAPTNTPPAAATQAASPVAATGPVVAFVWQAGGGSEPLANAAAVALAPDGTVWVLDAGNNRFQLFAPDGTFLETWGAAGSGDGQFDFVRDPSDPVSAIGDIAFDAQGGFYIADAANRRVQRFGADRAFLGAWGGFGPGDGKFVDPIGVDVDAAGNVFVIDDGRDDVQKFDADGAFLAKFGGREAGQGRLHFTGTLDVDADGNVWVADFGNSRVVEFAGDGAFLQAWGDKGTADGQFATPVGIAVDGDGRVFVTDFDNRRVQVFDGAGTFLGSWDGDGTGDGQFVAPAGVALDGTGGVYVSDDFGNRVVKFRLLPPLAPAVAATPALPAASPAAISGSPAGFVWEAAGGDGGLNFPAAMALDPQGRLWVADTGNDRFAIFDGDGTFLENWGTPGKGDGEFSLRRANGDGYGGIAFAPDGAFYVLDVGNYRVQKFDKARRFVMSWGGFGRTAGTFTDPIGLAVDAAGTVYVLDDVRDVVERFGPDGAAQGSFDAHPGSNPGLNSANGLAVDAAGNVYVSNLAPIGVEKFDPAGNLVATIGAPGDGAGQFRGQPWFMAIDAAGRLFVGDNHRIEVFDAAGRYLTEWGGAGQGDGEITFPTGIVLDGRGSAYVADAEAGRVVKFRLLPPLAPEDGTPEAATPTA